MVENVSEPTVSKENYEWKEKSGKRARWILTALCIYGYGMMAFLYLIFSQPGIDPNYRAVILMAIVGLFICWIAICGTIMFLIRNKIKAKAPTAQGHWMIFFVVFATGLLLLEEVFTVTMTNLVEVFGGEYGKAYITASDNYFETVLLHSAIVIWPAYIFWAWWLKKYDFHPNMVMLLYGITGLFSEMSYGGIEKYTEIGMWVFVYGLMIWLPAYCVPENRGAVRPKWYHYPLTWILPILFQLPFIIGVMVFRDFTGHTFPFVAD